MSDKRKTAVEWAFEQITNIDWKHLSDSDRNDLFDQAKAFEREQMRLIYEGILQNFGTNIKKSDLPTFNEYYEQTYGE